MNSRGPSDLEVALGAVHRDALAVLDIEQELERRLRQLHASQAKVRALGHHPFEPTFGRPVTAADQVLRGVAFWDRDTVDATPAPARLEVAK